MRGFYINIDALKYDIMCHRTRISLRQIDIKKSQAIL